MHEPDSDSATRPAIRAVLFDFGGVVTTSPFEAFAAYERSAGLPIGIIRDINSTDPDDNAWARLERSEVDTDGFVEAFEREARERGHEIDGRKVLDLLAGDIRPSMVTAIRRIAEAGLVVACLTNNFRGPDGGSGSSDHTSERAGSRGPLDEGRVKAMFDHVVQSAVLGVRKPEPEFYRRALEVVGVSAHESVFLDDLGINLKPARSMGMTTIKVTDPDQALAELASVLGIELD